MNIKRVKQGARITFISGIYMILLGVFFIFFIKFNMRQSFNAINLLWGFFSRYNANIANLLVSLNILSGTFLISFGIIIMYLSDFIIKRKEKMTWVMLFITGIINWAALLVITFLMNNIWLTIASLIGWLIFIFGMLLPIKYYLEKEYKEY